MATLTPVQSKLTGTSVSYVAAGGSGDKFMPGDHREFRVKNGSGVSTTVTVTVPGNTPYGAANPTIGGPVAAGAEATFGPFPASLGFGNPADSGLISVACSPSTSITVAVVDV